MTNARTKTRAEVEAEFKQKYGWADGVRENPLTFVDHLASHPEYGPQLLAKAARLLQARRGQGQPALADKPQPDTPIVDVNGTPTGRYTYSAEQYDKLEEWRDAQREAKLAERFGPLEKLQQRISQAEQHAQIRQQAHAEMASTLTELRQQPHFTEHEAAIKQALLDHEEWGDNVYRAYTHVLTTQVLPTLSRTEQQKVLDSLQTKAAGATVNPGMASPSQAPKFKDFGEAIRYYDAHPDEAAAMAKR